MGKIISISNQKGGVGKTTTSVSLAASLGILEKKVLLIDADPQGNASSGIGINSEDFNFSIYDVLLKNCKAKDAVIKTSSPNLDLIPANIDLVAIEIELVDIPKREYVFKSVFSEIINDYDFLIIDCPPSLGLITLNALTASNSVIIPFLSSIDLINVTGIFLKVDSSLCLKCKVSPLVNKYSPKYSVPSIRNILSKSV